MKRLLVVRHAKSEEGLDNDALRSLTVAGVESAFALGQKIQSLPFQAELVLVSPARRAQQTLDEIKKSLDSKSLKLQNADNLYQGRLYDVLRLIQSTDDSITNLLIVGHNPVFSELINYLGDESVVHLNPGGCYLLEFTVAHWADLETVKAKLLLVNNS